MSPRGQTFSVIDAPIHLIDASSRGREIDKAHVANLAVSISEGALENPLGIVPIPSSERVDGGPLWRLRTGGHRYEAVKLLNWRTVPAVVREGAATDARLAEVDENLIRLGLNPLQRANAIADRLEAWGAKFPERVSKIDGLTRGKVGRPKNGDKLSPLANDVPASMGFAEDTAHVAGVTAKTVKRALAIYRGIPAAQQAMLAGTWIAKNDAVLRQIAGVADPVEQAGVIQQLLDGKTKSVSDARALVAGGALASGRPSDPEAALKAVQKAWKGASKSQREAILDWLGGQPLPKGWEVRRG